MRKRAAEYVFDSVVLSNFALANGLAVLGMRYKGRGVITSEVLDELARGIDSGHSALSAVLDIVADGVFREEHLSLKERQSYMGLLRTLGSGEASCIALVKTRHMTVVSDDRAARAACRDAGVTFTGTVGILVACHGDGTLTMDAADTFLSKMIEAGFYSPVTRLRDIL
jgi:predicted nucleic acid-binding protein